MRRVYFYVWTFCLIINLGLVGCNNDDSVTPAAEPDVVVINEGNFGDADGSFTTFNSATGVTLAMAFERANSVAIGATIQNAIVHQGSIYAVTNAADKLEICDASTLSSVATISSGLTTPYFFAAVGNKGYVSNWGTFNSSTFAYEDSYISVVDLVNNTIVGQIEREGRPQGLLIINSKLYIANVDGNSVTVLDAGTGQLVTNITVPNGPDRMVLDVNGKIWVICNSGNLVRIDPQTGQVETIITGIQASGFNERMVINGAGDRLYYLSSTGFAPSMGAIYAFGIADTTAPTEVLITGNNFYGLGLDPDEDILYVSDNNAFQGTGTVIRYQLDGSEIDNFPAGRAPNGFIFK